MAKARMLHKTISTSLQVNNLSLSARLLFTWMIPHTDDDGRLKGQPEYIKAMVTPMTKWSFKKIEGYLTEMHDAGLIIRWWNNKNECFIEFPNWKNYQSIKSDRYKPSDLPSFAERERDRKTPDVIQNVSTMSPQSNVSESNPSEVNKSESSGREREYEGKPNYIADKKHLETKDIKDLIDPHEFEPTNDAEALASKLWEEFEPDNQRAFTTTYLYAVKVGMSSSEIYVAASEIRQDPTVKNKGALFRAKVSIWIAAQKSRK